MTDSSKPINLGGQSYDSIKSECQATRRSWEDKDFPAVDSSIFFKEPPSCYPGIVWKRPSVSGSGLHLP